MKGQQFSVGIFTAAVLIFVPVLGSIQAVDQKEYGIVDPEDNNIFQGVHTQPEPLNFEVSTSIKLYLMCYKYKDFVTSKK